MEAMLLEDLTLTLTLTLIHMEAMLLEDLGRVDFEAAYHVTGLIHGNFDREANQG